MFSGDGVRAAAPPAATLAKAARGPAATVDARVMPESYPGRVRPVKRAVAHRPIAAHRGNCADARGRVGLGSMAAPATAMRPDEGGVRGETCLSPPEQERIQAADGVALNFARWPLAAAPPPRARILIVHGRGEHGGRYAPVAAALAAERIACCAVDLRGFGRSGRGGGGEAAPGSIRRFEEYLLDLDAAVSAAGRAGEGAGGAGGAAPPLFLLGHSAGALAAVRWCEERPERARAALRGLILSSPYLGMRTPVPAAKMLVVRLLSLLNPDAALPTSGTPNTRDEACSKAYREDPLTVKSPSARWLTEVVKHQDLALRRADRLGLPLLVLQGAEDTASDPAVSRRFAERAGGDYREYAGCLHEVLNEVEPDRAKILADLAAWVAARAGAATAT